MKDMKRGALVNPDDNEKDEENPVLLIFLFLD